MTLCYSLPVVEEPGKQKMGIESSVVDTEQGY